MKETAKRAFVAALVFVGVIVAALALWKLKVILALLFTGLIIAAAMRPGVDALRRLHIPRLAGIFVHYLALAGAITLVLWFVVPIAQEQITKAVPTSRAELKSATKHSTGVKHEILKRIQQRLNELPKGDKLVKPTLDVTKTAFEVLIGIFFTFASAAYWIFERERAERVLLAALPRKRRRVVRDTWNLIDGKLGAYVRGQLLLVVFVATVLSFVFWLIGLRFWLLVGAFAGIVELIPVIGPLAAGAVAVGVGFTTSWRVALAAGIAVLAVRLVEDYVVIPKVLGGAVGLTPLTVLFSVAAVAVLFGGFSVLLAIPFVAMLATIIDVVLLKKDPGAEETPAVLFPAKEAES
jgi:predicted PurR-regulated permease PerM